MPSHALYDRPNQYLRNIRRGMFPRLHQLLRVHLRRAISHNDRQSNHRPNRENHRDRTTRALFFAIIDLRLQEIVESL